MRSGTVDADGRRGKLFFTVGLPQGGKSYIANQWANRLFVNRQMSSFAHRSNPRVVLGGDDFRLALHGQEYALQGEGAVFAMIDVAARALLSRGFDVMVDETCTTEQTLMRYLLIDPDAVAVFVETPPEECGRRAVANGKEFLLKPIAHMARQLEVLTEDFAGTVQRVRERIAARYHNTVVPEGV